MRERREYAEPFKIKAVESIQLIPRDMRLQAISDAGYNVFNLPSEAVYVDLLTDSGTSAMSDRQWSVLMHGDEAYAGSTSYRRLREVVEEVFGYPYVAPTHQGRAAEHILMTMLVKPGDRVLGNMHFDTTQGHILLKDAEPVDLVFPEGLDPQAELPFKGNIDLAALERELGEHAAGRQRVPFVLITVTCNNNGGQPVSMANIRDASRLARQYGVPVFFDAARFAENCYFVREREPGYAAKSVAEIAREMFSYGAGCTMSAKKDGLVNIGGFLAFRDEATYRQAVQWQIVFEGFATYGGLAGRDLEAMAQGLREVLSPEYLENRIGQVSYLAERLDELGVPRVRPAGGHGVYVDARPMLPQVEPGRFPGQAVVTALYEEGGVRAVELGSLAFARRDAKTGETIYPPNELVRLAIPRRVYTDRHMDHVARTMGLVMKRRHELRGLRLLSEAPVLRHFTARLEPLP
ncbi:MAG: tryptophanase [Bacillota bacterium]|nr:tryptophanase [Bacillota bacterium]